MRPCDPRDPCCLAGESEYVDRWAETLAAGDDLSASEQEAEADRAADAYERELDRPWADPGVGVMTGVMTGVIAGVGGAR